MHRRPTRSSHEMLRSLFYTKSNPLTPPMPDPSGSPLKWHLVSFGIGVVVSGLITFLVMDKPIDRSELERLKTDLVELEQQKAESDELIVILKKNMDAASVHQTPDQHIDNGKAYLLSLPTSALLDTLKAINNRRPE